MSEPARVRKSPPHPAPDPRAVQRRASDPASSVWVGASAGSGKTTVLVSRVLRLLLAGTPPQRILCLTFTRAAAAEMSNRISEKLSHWATCSDDALRTSLDELQNQPPEPEQLTAARRLFARTLSCPGGMRIRTIHAFCQEVLRRFPIEAGVAPHFSVIEDRAAHFLQYDVQRELLRVADAAPDSDLGHAAQLVALDLGEYGFERAMAEMLGERSQIEKAIAAAGGLKNLILQSRLLLNLAPGENTEKLRRDAVQDKILPRSDLARAAEALLQGGASCKKSGERLLVWLKLPVDQRADVFDDYLNLFFTGKGEIRQKLVDKKTAAVFPDAEIILQQEAARLDHIRQRCAAAAIAESTEAILTLGDEMVQRFKKRKTDQALLDYDDLVIRADKLLHKQGIAPWVLYKLDGGLDHILVDEAQDTSRAQWGIVQALTEEFFSGLGAQPDHNRTLFVVGDEKQSIFSFQHADPQAFSEMRRFFQRRIDDAEKPYREVPLHMSFRSAPAILGAVDAIFANDRARQGVSSESVEHYPARSGMIGRVEVWPLIKKAEKDKDESEWVLPLVYETERDPQAELANLIAARIGGLIAEEHIAPGDIMILLRRRGRFADLMVRALKQAKVPITGVDRMILVKQLAVMDLLALMQFALLPEDDLNLASVLRGPLLGLSEDQLMQLAIGRKGSLWQSLRDNPAFTVSRDYLQSRLNEADFTTPFSMLARILNEPCPGSAISGRQALWSRLGLDALDPIDELLNAAQEFGQRQTSSLQGFLHWLTVAETEIKRELDHGGGQVRIMTVHAAKGLEASIVFLPDTADMPRATVGCKLLWDGGGAPLYLTRKPAANTARRLWDAERQKQIEEYRRLFYVALTRAANRLYIAGWEPGRSEGENFADSWYALAREGLQSLHQPELITERNPLADIVFADPELKAKAKETATKKSSSRKSELPAWARKAAPVEAAAKTPLAPSRLAAESEPPVASPDKLYARGRIIHRLLESLPDVADDKRDTIAKRFLANPQHRLPPAEQKEIADEVLKLLRDPNYAPLFAPGSRAEVPLSGFIGAQPIAGQVDRLCVLDKEVWIIDYKSNRPPPARIEDVSIAYRNQLAAYRAVLTEIYPGKAVRCFLLWTYKPTLMEIPEKLLLI